MTENEIKLWAEHVEVLRTRAITPEYAWACGVRSWSGKEAARQLHQYKVSSTYPGMPLYQHGTGIEIPYPVESTDGVKRARTRLDDTKIEVESDLGSRSHGGKTVELPRYVAQKDVRVSIYRPPFVRLLQGGDLVPWATVATDPSIAMHVTEAPLKALSLSDNGMPAIGLGGVLAGPHVKLATLEDWGDVDPRSVGSTLRPNPDLVSIDWRGRQVFVVFDANLSFRPLVALGAARLAFLLEGLGAVVSLVRVPLWSPHDARGESVEQALAKGAQDQGPDDYLFRNGLQAFRALVEQAEPANVAALVEHRTRGLEPRSPERRAVLGTLLEDLYLRAYCQVRGDAYVAAHVAAAFSPTFKVSAIRAALKEFATKIAESARSSTDGEENPFSLKGGKLHHGDTAIADFMAKIEEEIVSDDGAEQTRIYRVAGELAGGVSLPVTEVDAKDFVKMEWVAGRWGARAIMMTKRGPWVAEAIQRLSSPKTTTKYTHFGWRTLQGERAFLMPGGALTRNGWIALDVEAPEKLARYKMGQLSATGVEGEEAFEWSLKLLDCAPHYITVPALLSVYMAPMVDMLGPTFVLWMHGPSGSAKSTFASLLALHYGTFDYKTLPETWISTVNALETTLWRGKDVLLPIDNLVPAQTARDQMDQVGKAVRLIQSYGDGSSRGRLNADAVERAARPPRCMPLATAEILPPENVSTLGRIFTLPFQGATYDFKLHDEIKARPELLQTALADWIQFLAGYEPATFKRAFEVKRKAVTNVFGDVLQGGHPRLAEHLALYLVVMEFLFRHWRWLRGEDLDGDFPDVTSHPLPVAMYEGLAVAAGKQPTSTSLGQVEELGAAAGRQSPAVQQWLSALRTMLTTGSIGLVESEQRELTAPEHLEAGDRWIPKVGWQVGREVWLSPSVAHDAVRRHLGSEWRWGDKEFQSQLKPYLVLTDGSNLGVKRVAGRARQRVWVLPQSLVLGEREAPSVVELPVDFV